MRWTDPPALEIPDPDTPRPPPGRKSTIGGALDAETDDETKGPAAIEQTPRPVPDEEDMPIVRPADRAETPVVAPPAWAAEHTA